MKKVTALLLALLMMLALVPSLSVFAYEDKNGMTTIGGAVYVNLALGKKYTTTGTRYANDNFSDTKPDGSLLYKLTDGNISYSGTDSIAGHECASGETYTDVVIDLEKVERVKAAQTDLWGGQWGIVSPTTCKVEFFYSVDGKDFTSMGNTVYTEDNSSAWVYGEFSATLDSVVEARYIKARYTNGRFRWSSEIFVYGIGEIAESEHVIQTVDGVDYICDFSDNCNVDTVISAFGSKKVEITSSKGAVKTNGVIGTGDTIKVEDKTYVTVVRGDLNGDGKVNNADYIAIRRNLLKQVEFTPAQKLAADVDKNGKIQIIDYITVRRYILKAIIDLDGNTKPVIVGVTMPEINDFYEATVKKTATGVTITIPECQEEGYSIEVSMVKTAWGTWNLGHYYVTENATKKTTIMNPGSTDWEYVFRVDDTKAGAGSHFSCGNHENEELVEIKFYDAKTGELLSDKDTFTATANGVKVVEKTRGHFDGRPDQPYITVTRCYVINGVDVWLECDFDFVRDAYFGLSYLAMCCIPKTSGNHIIYNNVDGTTREWTTKLSGTGSGKDYQSSDMDYGNPAASVDMYGDADPSMRFHVEIYDATVMCDDFTSREKTFFWDMNTAQNKVYFSKFNQLAPTLVEKGTHWDTLSRWSFVKVK